MSGAVDPTPAEIAHRAAVAFTRRDRAAWDATQDPGVEMLPADVWPETERVVGRDALWEFYLGVDDVWEPGGWEFTAVEESDNTVLVHQHRSARGRSSSAEVEFSYWVRVTVAAGLVVRHEWFAERPPQA